jgi:hypothetical protein
VFAVAAGCQLLWYSDQAMTESPSAPRVTIWTDAPRTATVLQIFKRMGDTVIPAGVGGPRVAAVDQLAQHFDCPREDDLRKLLVETPASFVVLATMDGVGAEDLAYATSSNATVLTLEPIWDDLDELAQSRRTGKGRQSVKAGSIVYLPRFDQCPGWASAADPMTVLGMTRLAALSSFGGPDSPSLFARLYDAWRMLRRLGPLPESVDASLISPGEQVPDTLRQMTGHLAVHARLTDGQRNAAAVIEASDRVPGQSRQLRLMADKGQLIVTDHSYTLHDEHGQLLDASQPPAPAASYAQLICRQWQSTLEQPHTPPPQPEQGDDRDLLACCLACLLSARTRQPESPRKLLELHAPA